jgi:hypothetical protein
MPRVIKMPTDDELPPGAVRDFTALLFRLYKAARRPTLDDLSKHIWTGYPPGPPEDDPGDPWPAIPPGHHPGIPAQDPYPANSASPGQPSGIDLIRRELEDPWAPPDFDEPPFQRHRPTRSHR